jgi:aspartyl-tRNA(Asn)/glutamyl-tRNA(Gln) amidotransferase subunit A
MRMFPENCRLDGDVPCQGVFGSDIDLSQQPKPYHGESRNCGQLQSAAKGITGMENTPLHYRSITKLATHIRTGEVSCLDLAEHYLCRVESLDKILNAFRLVSKGRAVAQARWADQALQDGEDLGLLHGMPYAAKDLFDVKGLPTTAGTHLRQNHIAAEDAAAIASLSRAGMVFLGKTNTVQFAFSGVGINHDHGTPRNPWSRTHHLPGGSSSGSAVAVAAGLVPVALGTDTGGSVRVPASLCGITGLKTTVGRISRAGVYPLSWTLDSVGILARTAEDTALVYQRLEGTDINDESTWGLAAHDVGRELKAGVRGMRLAFAESIFFEDVDPEVEKAVRDCGQVFKGLGAQVGSIDFSVAIEALQLNPGKVIIAAEGYTINKKWLEEHLDELDPVVAQRMIKGKEVSAEDYLHTCRTARQLRALSGTAFRDVDALLVPTTPLPALPVAAVDTTLENYLTLNAFYLRNTCIGNILNLCGLSIPCGFTQAGLPIGLMIYGKSFQEDIVLRLGYAFQQVTGWHRRIPDLSWASEA